MTEELDAYSGTSAVSVLYPRAGNRAPCARAGLVSSSSWVPFRRLCFLAQLFLAFFPFFWQFIRPVLSYARLCDIVLLLVQTRTYSSYHMVVYEYSYERRNLLLQLPIGCRAVPPPVRCWEPQRARAALLYTPVGPLVATLHTSGAISRENITDVR